MVKTDKNLSPEDIFALALQEHDRELTPAEMRLLTSGLQALREHRSKPLTNAEQKSVLALISYVAYTQNVSESCVEAIVVANYNANSVSTLPTCRYQEIVEYLVDLEVDKIVN
ncbi:MAG: hypothetical protein AB7S81_05295 [Bdellovibrionales bacterium]